MKKMAVVLSGCGNKDGSEITEAVSTLIALSQYGVKYQCFAPNKNIHPKNFLTNQVDQQSERNLLQESARISRSQITDLKDLKAKDFDAVIFPGGYGAALNLSDWAEKGAQAQVLPDVTRVINEFYEQSKPIGAICIAPVLIAKVLGSKNVNITLGNGKEIAQEIKKTGAEPVDCPVDDYITDRDCKVVTTPAYMYDEATPYEVFKGISGLVKEVFEMS